MARETMDSEEATNAALATLIEGAAGIIGGIAAVQAQTAEDVTTACARASEHLGKVASKAYLHTVALTHPANTN
jgi:hypothetical protein